MNKKLAALAATGVLLLSTAAAFAAGGMWLLTAPSGIDFGCGVGTYNHTLDTVSNNDPSEGMFTGTGHYNPNWGYTWDIDGTISEDDISFTLVYTGLNPGYTLNGVGTINPDGSIDGTTDGNCQTFSMDAGSAISVTASFNGGGHLLEEEGSKRKDWHDVSFGGWVHKYSDSSLSGEFQVNLHNVGGNSLDKSKFHGTDVTVFNLYTGNGTSCNDAMNVTFNGTFDGEPGYSMIFRSGDFGSPNTADTARVTIYDGENATGVVLYDTHSAGEFEDESSCVGGARTGLDTGNLTIQQ